MAGGKGGSLDGVSRVATCEAHLSRDLDNAQRDEQADVPRRENEPAVVKKQK